MAFHEAVLDELLEERVVSSRGRRNSRVVKRKVSNFPTKCRNPQKGTVWTQVIVEIIPK
jgi:hypothetical protein